MQARRLPAMRGAYWLLEGYRLFRRNPPLITALTLVYLLVVQAMAVLLPGVGPILLPLLLPALTLIVANGCRLVATGQAPGKATLFHGLAGPHGNGPALLKLGGLQLLGAVLLVLINMALSGESGDPFADLEAAATAPAEGDAAGAPQPPVADAAMLGLLLRVLLLAAPLIIAFWFAPFLVGWDSVGPVKAVFFSTVASWRNWRAMGLFSLATLVLAGIIPGFILIVVGLLPGMTLGAAMVTLRLLLAFFVAPVLTASIYASYVDIFHSDADTHA